MAADKQQIRRKRTRIAILLCLVLIPVLTYLETVVFQLGEISLPISGNVLVFSLINVNIMLLMLMVFLVVRNLLRFIFEQRQLALGKSLRTRLVISFISMSLIPTILLFFISLQFISTSMDYWFNSNVEASLDESLKVAQDIYQQARDRSLKQGISIAMKLESKQYGEVDQPTLDSFFQEQIISRDLDGLMLYSDQRQILVAVQSDTLNDLVLPEVPAEMFRLTQSGEANQTTIQSVPMGELVLGANPVFPAKETGALPQVLITTILIPTKQLHGMKVISQGIEGYRQLMLLKNPLKTSLIVMLLIVTLLIIFSAVWFGFYIAQGLTGPIDKLAEATRRVADGELDFVLEKESDDEMGLLVDSFNQMTRDLLASNKQLESVNIALQDSNIELDERRQYIETILQNVPAGVISFDAEGRITSINRFAEKLLQISKEKFLYQDYRSTLQPEYKSILENFLTQLEQSGKSTIQRPLQLSVGKETFSLLVNITQLEDEAHIPLGFVLVFDNLTQLEKAQRIAAWREVARRIAHEVKNPLTPIQLSAQRLRKRYLYSIDGDTEVFDLCTQTIINQVEELKRLVSEFSSFARMPSVEKTTNNLEEMVKEILVFYEESHGYIDFHLLADKDMPPFKFDLKQVKRVLINLIENAIAVLPDGGIIEIALAFDQTQQTVSMEVRDNGPGIPYEVKLRLFEPYFSTKKSGTGLGLAIANTVIAEHGGTIKVRDNVPNGAVFIVELPIST